MTKSGSLPRVSVVVPCYNYGRYLEGCLESVLAQPGVEVQVLVIDDASSDDTPAVVSKVASRDHRVESRRHVTNHGHIATYNEGLQWASGDYTLLLSADDLLVPGALARAASLLDTNPSVGLVYGRKVTFRSGEPLPSYRVSPTNRWRVRDGRAWLAARCRDGRNPIWSPEVLMRTSVQRKVGGFRGELPHMADRELWMRFAAHADVGQILSDQAFYRIHTANMHHEWRYLSPLDYLDERIQVLQAFFTSCGDRVPDAEHLHRLGRRAVADEAMVQARLVLEQEGRREAVVDELVALATRMDPGAGRRRAYWSLRLHRRLGPRVSRAYRPALNLADRIQGRLRWLARQRGWAA